MISFEPKAWEDYLYWQQTDKKVVRRINQLIKDCMRQPFEGLRKPEPLRHSLSGYWSRRVTGEHRMVYKVKGKQLIIVQLRFHY